MSSENEEIIRRAYQRAEDKDIEAFIGCFTDDGTFTLGVPENLSAAFE